MRRSRHPKKEIEAALKHAEDHGWVVEEKKRKRGHGWGRVLSPGGGIVIRIDHTPRSPGHQARVIRRAVYRLEKEQGTR
jgi:hypothetical protein